MPNRLAILTATETRQPDNRLESLVPTAITIQLDQQLRMQLDNMLTISEIAALPPDRLRAIDIKEHPTVVDPSEPPGVPGQSGTPTKDILQLYGKVAKVVGIPIHYLIGVPLDRLNKAVGTSIFSLSKVSSQVQKKAIESAVLQYYISRTISEEEKTFYRGIETGEIEWAQLKKIPIDIAKGLKNLVPLPGFGKNGKTIGDVAVDNYQTLIGDKPPSYYKLGMDIASETLILGGVAALGKLATTAKFSKIEPLISTKKLTRNETVQARRIFGPRKLAQLAADNPGLVRTEIAKTGGTITASTSPPDGVVPKLISLVKAAKPARKQTELLKTQELGRRVGRAQKILHRTPTAREGFKASLGALKGELPVAAFTPPELGLTVQEMESLYETVRSGNRLFFQRLNTAKALDKLLVGQIPTNSELRLLQKTFGSKLTSAILSKRPLGEKLGAGILDIANVPRSIVASGDHSFPLRQGLILAVNHPKRWLTAVGRGYKAMVNPKYAQALDDSLDLGRFSQLRDTSRLYRAPLFGSVDITAKEEAFMSNFAERIPGLGRIIKASERAFVTTGNQLRANVFDDIAGKWAGTGKTSQDYKDLAKFINHATGRGDLGKTLNELGPALNAFFFSPRFQASRIQTILDAIPGSQRVVRGIVPGRNFAKDLANTLVQTPAARKVAAAELARFVGTGIGVLGLVSLAAKDNPDISVENDPRSSDFGKIRIGNTRYEFWAGMQPMARVTAQLITGERKSTATGKVQNINRLEAMASYLEFKLSPTAGIALDVLRKETRRGEELKFDKATIKSVAFNRLTFIFAKDIVEAIRHQGLDGSTPFSVVGAFHGLGVQTWPVSPFAQAALLQDKYALETFGKLWQNLGPAQQQMIQKTNPDLEQLRRQGRFEQVAPVRLEKALRQSFEAGKNVESRIDPDVKTELERLQVSVGNVPRSLGRFTLNDNRFEVFQQLLAGEINKLKPILDSKSFRSLSDAHKVKFIEQRIQAARKRAAIQIKRIAAREGFQ